MERSQRDGQWLALQQQSQAVIENNTAAIKAMTSSHERLHEDRRITHKKLDTIVEKIDRHDERACDIHTDQKLLSSKIGGSK